MPAQYVELRWFLDLCRANNILHYTISLSTFPCLAICKKKVKLYFITYGELLLHPLKIDDHQSNIIFHLKDQCSIVLNLVGSTAAYISVSV